MSYELVDFHALICVHDLTNRKSLSNLMATSEEVLEGDPESGIRNVPILLVGTKQNEVPASRRGEVNERAKRMAEGIENFYCRILNKFYSNWCRIYKPRYSRSKSPDTWGYNKNRYLSFNLAKT